MLKGLILHALTDKEYEGERNLVIMRRLILTGNRNAAEELCRAGKRLLWSDESARALLASRFFAGEGIRVD